MPNIIKSQMQCFALPSHAQSTRSSHDVVNISAAKECVMLCKPLQPLQHHIKGSLPSSTKLLTWPPHILSSLPDASMTVSVSSMGLGNFTGSLTAWYQHLASTCTEEECQCIQTARLLGDQIASLPPLTKPSSTPNCDYSVPPSIWRANAEDLPSRPGKTAIPTNMWDNRSVCMCTCSSPLSKLGLQIMGTR